MSETQNIPLFQGKYFRREKCVLKALGISFTNDESRLYKVYSYVIFLFIYVCFPIISSGDLLNNRVEVVAELYVCVAGAYMGLGIVVVVYLNRVKLGKLMATLEREPFVPNMDRGGETENKLLNEWLSFCRRQSLLVYTGIAGSLGPLIVTTLIKRITSSDSRDWELSFGPLTVLNVTYSPNYEITWTYQNVCLLSVSYSMSSCTVILSGILAFISIQFRMLQTNLRNIVDIAWRKLEKGENNNCKNKTRSNFEIPWKYLQQTVKEAIQFHICILDVAAEIEKTFSLLMLWLYLITLIMLCFEVFKATQIPSYDPRLFRMVIEWGSISFQPFVICYCGEQVAHESLEVGRAAYEAQFVGTDLLFQKELVIIIRRSQNVVKIKAGKLVETSMATFAWIIRTSYSAFMMLKKHYST